jgi:hypothetical protein
LFVQFDWFVGRVFWWAPVGGLVAMMGILTGLVADTAALTLPSAALLVGIVAGFFVLIGLDLCLCGVVGFCRAWRDGFVGIGLIKLALAFAVGGFLVVAGILAVLKFVARCT